MTEPKAPDSLVLDFLRSNGEPLRLIDLGPTFLQNNRIPAERHQHPFRVAIEKRRSHAGNAFYDYAQNAVPLPDGLATWLRLEGSVIPFGNIRPSKKGYPTREGTANLVVGGTLYVVTAFLTESKDPYWVKIVAHKVPDRSANIRKAQAAPRGGRILL